MSNIEWKRRVVASLEEHSAAAVPAPAGLWKGIAVEIGGRPVERASRANSSIPGGAARGLLRPRTISLGLLVLTCGVMLPFWLLRGSKPAAASELLQKASAASSFVPAGKVRHIVTAHAPGERTDDPYLLQDLWLANGLTHLLLWKPAARAGSARPLPTYIGGDTRLVDEDHVWSYQADSGRVYMGPYFAGSVQTELPSQRVIDELIKRPDTRITGTGTLDGRSVVIVAGHAGTIVAGDPLTIAQGSARGYSTAQHDYQLWIDSGTLQIVQEEHYLRPDAPAPGEPQVYTSTTWIMTDELLDRDEVAADLFKFKAPEGAALIDTTTLPTPAPVQGTPEWAQHGWHLFRSDEGRFRVEMPGPVEVGFTNAGAYSTQMYGIKSGGVSYVVRYRDYPAETVVQRGVEKWLDLEQDDAVAQSQGTLLGSSPLMLDGTPGREVRSQDPDGRYRITRVYLAGARLYKITLIAPDPDYARDDVQRFLDSFKIIAP